MPISCAFLVITLAVLAAFNETPVRFVGIANLRVKECDRVAALAAGLSRIVPGLGLEEGNDLLVASNPGLAGKTLPASIETYADHRIAMSFLVMGLATQQPVRVDDTSFIATSFPEFVPMIRRLGGVLS
mgnify:CR=1 FL=1